jgi:hypothetical protein
MSVDTYRASEPPRPSPEGAGSEHDVAFVAVVLVLAAAADVVGTAAHHAAFTGLHALAALTAVLGALWALVRVGRSCARALRGRR